MPCYHPLQAWRTTTGDVVLSKLPVDGKYLRLPCGNCLGCRQDRAQNWALRCQLELQDHPAAVFATLTYDDQYKPLTLRKHDVSAYIKKARKNFTNKLRFFASGEYGDQTQRPHYHAIIYGAAAEPSLFRPGEYHCPGLEEAWTKGHVRIYPATPANIAYTAGYCSKKIGYRHTSHERVDPSTGEVYQWQPPFILMSRNPGIGATARDKYLNAWRLYAIKDGHKMTVPRYYKQRYKDTATPEQLEALQNEIDQLNITPLTRQQLDAAEKIAAQRQKMAGAQRTL